METELGPREPQDDSFFKNYKPPPGDIITLPRHVIYVLLATAVVLLALYAIIRHLIRDLIHDLADWLFGEQPPEVMVNPWECRDKFRADWSPQAMPELEELARAELEELARAEPVVVMEGNHRLPAVWVIPDYEPRPSRTGPRVDFGKII